MTYISKQAFNSVFGRDFMAFANAFVLACGAKFYLHLLMNKPNVLSIMTDSISIFYELAKATTTAEKQLLMDSKAIRESC